MNGKGNFVSSILVKDFSKAITERELWSTLAVIEIKRRYKGTKLGVLWRCLNVIIVGVCLGYFYSVILKQEFSDYIPYLISGYVTWELIQQMITDGCRIFTNNASQIKEVPLSYISYVFKHILKCIINFSLGLISVIFVLLFFDRLPQLNIVEFIFGVLVLIFAGFGVGVFLGVLVLLIKDMYELINNILRLVFFITPILWMPELAGERAFLVHFNPLYYFVDIVRSPLLGEQINENTIYITFSIASAFLVFSAFLYTRYRSRIPFLV
nr:ABC transporter permease [Vibrio cincinnatiensis]